MNWSDVYLIAPVVIYWHWMLYVLHRHFAERKQLEYWEAGHDVGRASVFIPKSQITSWLRDAGVDTSNLDL